MYKIKCFEIGISSITHRKWEIFFNDDKIFEIIDKVHHFIRCGADDLKLSERYDYFKHGGCNCTCVKIKNIKILHQSDNKYRIIEILNNNYDDTYTYYYELNGCNVSKKHYFIERPCKTLIYGALSNNHLPSEIIFNDGVIESFKIKNIFNKYMINDWCYIYKYFDTNDIFNKYKILSLMCFECINKFKIYYIKFENNEEEIKINYCYNTEYINIIDKDKFNEYILNILKIFKSYENNTTENIEKLYKDFNDYKIKCINEIYKNKKY